VSVEKIGDKGRATVSIDGVACGSVEIPRILRMISSNGMDAGCDAGSAVSDDYTAPFHFQGKIARLVFDMPGRPAKDEAEAMAVKAKVEMARQ
jgi:arylsulfatase